MAVTTKPTIVALGAGTYERLAYTDNEVFAPGDLIRILATGSIGLAKTGSPGAVHGIALETGKALSTDAMPVFLFAPDTIIKIQCTDGISPDDLIKGVPYAIDSTTGLQAITAVTVNGIAMVVGYASDTQPWSDAIGTFDEDSSVENNSVLVRFTAATLDIHVN